MWNNKKRFQLDRVWLFCDGSGGRSTNASANAEATVYRNRSQHRAPVGNHRRGIPQARAMPIVAGCGAGAALYDPEGRLLACDSKRLAPMSNNEAEYAGLLLGLDLARRFTSQEVVCMMDSNVVVGQIEGFYAVNSQNLRSWYWQARTAIRQFEVVRFSAIPREWNRVADGLAAQAGLPWNEIFEAVDSG